MKFFWKLYLAIMLMVISCFSIGGYMFIETGFKSSLQRETEMAYQENDILFSSVVEDLYTQLAETINGYSSNYAEVDKVNIIQNSISALKIQTFSGNISFCLRDQNGNMRYQNGGFYDDSSLIRKIDSGTRGYKIAKNKDEYKIHVIRKLDIEDEEMYLENARDISSLFKGRQEQYRNFMYCIGLLSVVGAIVIFIITRLLVRPIKKLSEAAKKMTAEGGLSEEIKVTSNDEIGQLTRDFNTMSKRLMSSMRELQEALNRQEIFVGNFAHELKTPLTSMIGYGDMLRSKKLSEEQVVNFSNLIVEEGKRLEIMSMKLMELIVLKKQDFVFNKVNIVDFFNEIQAVVTPIMENSEVDFKVQVEADNILMETDLMKTVCLNLLDNARKAIEKNGIIEFIGIKDKLGYRIIVKDNGCGIDINEISKIKEAFYMVDKSRSRSAGGAGLGLAICDQIIKLHHGDLIFESIKGQGTIVTVLLKGGEIVEED